MIPYEGANSGAMNSFFGTQYSQSDLQRYVSNRRSQSDRGRRSSTSGGQQDMNLDQSLSGEQISDLSEIMVGESLEDIILQNNQELERRQSVPQHHESSSGLGHEIPASGMMKFGSDLRDFQFGATAQTDIQGNRRNSGGNMDLMTRFEDMDSSSALPVSQDFFPDMHMANSIDLNSNNYPALPTDNMFSNPYQRLGDGGSMATMGADFAMASMGIDDGAQDVHARRMDIVNQSAGHIVTMTANRVNDLNASFGTDNENPTHYPDAMITSDNGQPSVPSTLPNGEKSLQIAKATKKKDFGSIYSTTGFDMLGVLAKVTTRKNPEVNLGAVDLSCAFVVCDITQNDSPIVYVSEVFERLTGYSRHEILGRNCRFLQAPNGQVMPGARRTYVDDESVIYIKNKLRDFQEVQCSLLNYRKGGQAFLNLLTMIPVSGNNPEEIQYYVGFQVDLVEHPNTLTSKDVSGLYNLDYSRTTSTMPMYIVPQAREPPVDTGRTISRDDVSAVLTSFSMDNNSDITKGMWDKILIENSDDVIHVLSLKGLFLYLSPSCRRILEYSPAELVNTALSSICHPSDIVPVTRELKDTSAGQPLNVVYRIRRKMSGYTWFESHGSLCVEQGKGRKFIVLVGRERPVYALSRLEIEKGGGICEGELWTKLSTSGMFLFVSSNVKSLLDRQPSELVGTSIQAVMRPESRIEFGRSLEKARTGKRVILKHVLMTKIGRDLQATTTIYPGDASEGQKPTFFVAQTRLTKPTRASPPTASQAGNNLSPQSSRSSQSDSSRKDAVATQHGGNALPMGTQDLALASRDNVFDELKTTRSTSWQFELRQMEKKNRILVEELNSLLASKKKRKRRRGTGLLQRDCANCHTTSTPEWRRGPSGQRDLCNSCGLRWAKQSGKVSPRVSTRNSNGSQGKGAESPKATSPPLQTEISAMQNLQVIPDTETVHQWI